MYIMATQFFSSLNNNVSHCTMSIDVSVVPIATVCDHSIQQGPHRASCDFHKVCVEYLIK